MSSNSRDSDWVEKEIIAAQNQDYVILPVLLEGKPFIEVNNIEYVDMQAWDGKTLAEKLKNALNEAFAAHAEKLKKQAEKQALKAQKAKSAAAQAPAPNLQASAPASSSAAPVQAPAPNPQASAPASSSASSAQAPTPSPQASAPASVPPSPAPAPNQNKDGNRTELVLAIIGVLIALATFLFGDDILSRLNPATTETAIVPSATTELIPTATTAVPSPDETANELPASPSPEPVMTELPASPSPEPATPTTAEPSPVSLPLNSESLAAWAASENIQYNSYIEAEIAQTQINHLAELTVPEYPTQNWCLNENDETILNWGLRTGLGEKLQMFVSIHENRLGDLQLSDFLSTLPANTSFESYAYRQQPLAAYTIFVIVLSSNQNANCYRFP